MECFQVIEEDEGIQQAILSNLHRRGGGMGVSVSASHPALLIVSPQAAARGGEIPSACRTVLLPGDAGNLLPGLHVASAVSYGTSPRDSLTVSSREDKRLWAALQRELVTLSGQVVERQEFPLTLYPGLKELPTLAVAGALLLLDVPPEGLG